MNTIKKNASTILTLLIEGNKKILSGKEIFELTHLSSKHINSAVSYLNGCGAIKTNLNNRFGDYEFDFIQEGTYGDAYYEHFNNDQREIIISLNPKSENNFEEDGNIKEHVNIRFLVERMNRSLEEKDYSAVLHTSATIFETLAKDIINSESIDNQSLKSFFDRYRKDSKLPKEILNYILEIYKNRNTTPLAGHGSTKELTIKEEEAIILCEMTKAFIRIEYKLKNVC